MEIRTENGICIITPLSPKPDMRECARIFAEIENYGSGKIGLDMSFIEECTYDFLSALEKSFSKTKLSAYNLNPDVMAILTLTGFDKFVKIFVCEDDFLKEKRILLNRKFRLV